MKEEPLYPFGFGLSYTTFRFDSLETSAKEIKSGASMKVKAVITNTGKRDAEEVVQFYISRDNAGTDEPASSLKGFCRISVQAGKTAYAEIDLASSAFESVNAEGDNVLLPGSYTITAAEAAPVPGSVEKGAAKPVCAKITVLDK